MTFKPALVFVLILATLSTYSKDYKVTANSLNIRECPSTSCQVIGKLHKDDVVNVISIVNNWATLTLGERKVFISASYIALSNGKSPKPSNEISSIGLSVSAYLGLAIIILLIFIIPQIGALAISGNISFNDWEDAPYEIKLAMLAGSLILMGTAFFNPKILVLMSYVIILILGLASILFAQLLSGWISRLFLFLRSFLILRIISKVIGIASLIYGCWVASAAVFALEIKLDSLVEFHAALQNTNSTEWKDSVFMGDKFDAYKAFVGDSILNMSKVIWVIIGNFFLPWGYITSALTLIKA